MCTELCIHSNYCIRYLINARWMRTHNIVLIEHVVVYYHCVV